MQNSPADNLPSLSSTSPFTSPPTTTSPPLLPRLLSSSTSTPPQRRDAAARATKALLRDLIREDWTWPTTPPLTSTPPSPPPLAWRERTTNSSSPSPSPSPSPANPYKYDTPDSLSTAMRTRKRKRRSRLLDELRWNPGLQTYIARRDAWTGGVTRGATSAAAPASAAPASGSSASDQVLELVPLHAPLLPASNPIRASITPATYPSIYSKVITQGLTPTIPINLADVTRAMVQGWKADGEWPPQSAGAEAPVGGKKSDGRGRGLMGGLRGVGRVRRCLGLGGEGEGDEGEGGVGG